MRIAFCSSEVFPFAKTGGLADVSGALPVALKKLGLDISVFMPCYKEVGRERLTRVSETVSQGSLGNSVPVYFIEHEKYFNRNGIYGSSSGNYPDNLERFQYFCAETLRFLENRKVKVDIVHCHDWPTALIPVYLKYALERKKFFAKTKSILTIHNMAYQGIFDARQFATLGLPQDLFGLNGFEFYGKINFLKAGLLFSDKVSTVSPRYAKEIQALEFGCGLSEVLKSRLDGVTGILNGIDYEIWDPSQDPLIRFPYSPADYKKGKAKNKIELQKKMKLPQEEGKPLLGFVGRLSSQKGIDLIAEMILNLRDREFQVVVQGVGDEKYQERFKTLAHQFPKRLAVRFEFDEGLAHHIYAGSDLFLMPSHFEPCGLSQMISLRYGTIPIVFKTGGLVDSIKMYDENKTRANGFGFSRYTKELFQVAVAKAIELYHDKERFEQLIKNAFNANFSWDQSAREYENMYQCLLSA